MVWGLLREAFWFPSGKLELDRHLGGNERQALMSAMVNANE